MPDLPWCRSVACHFVGSGHSRRVRERVGLKGTTNGVTHAIDNEGIGCHEKIPIRSFRPSMLFRNIFESRRLKRRAMIGYVSKAIRFIAVGFSNWEKRRDLGKAVVLWKDLFWSVTRPLGDLWPR